jgi:hypothetical protein
VLSASSPIVIAQLRFLPFKLTLRLWFLCVNQSLAPVEVKMRVAILGATGLPGQHTLAAAAAAGHGELGFTATETLENAIERALAWFRSNGYVKSN